MWTKRVLRSVSFFLLASSVGCASSVPDRTPDGRIIVEYWEKWNREEGEAMQAVVDRFNASQDRIYVKYLSISRINQKTLVATSGGNPPDIAGLTTDYIPAFAEKVAIIPLDQFADRAGLREEDYIPVLWEMCHYDGRLYALPTTGGTVALHWNKRLFREAGLDPEQPPRTLKELDEFAERLTKRDEDGNYIQMGFLPGEPPWWSWVWAYWFGGRLWDGGSQITLDSPDVIRAYDWVQSYIHKYGQDRIKRFTSGFGNFSSSQNPFMAETVAMVMQGPWMHTFIEMYNPSLEWGVAPFPTPEPTQDLVTVVTSDLLVIPVGARHPEEAFEFMRFVNRPEIMEMLCLGQKKFGPLATTSPEFLNSHPHPNIQLFIDLAKSPNARYMPPMAARTELMEEISVAFDKIWLLGVPPEEALRHANERVQAKYDRILSRKRKRLNLAATQ